MLFHYHFWTPYVEETEQFYIENGFRVSQRIGRYEGEYQEFNPPLDWKDFRDKEILFRIIEVRKGAINITFGYGKKVKFDHIGFLVSENDHEKIISNAQNMNWKVNVKERRTFIGTPYGFRIELQRNKDAIDQTNSPIRLTKLKIATQSFELDRNLTRLFGQPIEGIKSIMGGKVTIRDAEMTHIPLINNIDPNGVKIILKHND
ncbi:hypothetical protein [Terrilactibacillus laevilacticus]|uniref:hypothetical protein n=1 Tax=Terrilactibacillus laevilacticus TaxID=1380157 RepID=UPI00114623D3|nr:hypothetical protein [Terrilactibacillus laevilacticus]